MLELFDRSFKITRNMLNDLLEKVCSMDKEMVNFSRHKETAKMNQVEILEMRNRVSEINILLVLITE